MLPQLYTVILAGRIFGKLERSEIITEVNAGLVSQKDVELQQMAVNYTPQTVGMPMPQYIVAQQPQAYAQPIYVQPVDPTAFQQ